MSTESNDLEILASDRQRLTVDDGLRLPLLDREQADALLSDGIRQYCWYEKETNSAERALAISTWCAILLGLVASALAAFPERRLLSFGAGVPEIARWTIVVLTLLVTLFSTTLGSRYRRLSVDRERGRIGTAAAINSSRAQLMYQPMTLSQRGMLVERFDRELLKVEADFRTFEGRVEPGP
jgi:hypothetical protein